MGKCKDILLKNYFAESLKGLKVYDIKSKQIKSIIHIFTYMCIL